MSNASDEQDKSKAAKPPRGRNRRSFGNWPAIVQALARRGHPVAMFDIQSDLLKTKRQALGD